MKNNIVIYKISNLINNKFYIGSAIDYNRRLREHKSMLRLNKHSCKHLQNAYNKYGIDNFKFEIIEQVEDKTKLIEREQYYIDTLKPEYNKNLIAGNSLGLKHTEESKRKISESRINNKWCVGRKLSEETRSKIGDKQKVKIYQYDLYNNLIGEFNSIKEASEITNINKHSIRDCSNGKANTGAGFIWKRGMELGRIKDNENK